MRRRSPGVAAMRLPDLKYGPKFGLMIQDLLSERFRHLVEKKFDIDLSNCPPCIVMMGNTTGAYNEGYSHPDSKHKIITVLVAFSAASGRTSAATCGCCAATIARTMPSSFRRSSAAC